MLDAVFGYAPGKIILIGEHAVVYGAPALAATLDRGVRVAVQRKPGTANGPSFRGAGLGVETTARPDPGGEGPRPLREALSALIDIFGDGVRDLAFVADGAIPTGAGLGSSAALSVALVRGVCRVEGIEADELAVMEKAHHLERVFHGNPSGVDHGVISHGGLVWFEKSEGGAVNIEAVTPKRPVKIVVCLTGKHAGTVHAVSRLRERMKRNPEPYQSLISSIGALSAPARRALESGSLGLLGDLMNINQGYLNALGVSTPLIEEACSVARSAGALGAKLTGAGGGGAVIALCDGDEVAPTLHAFEALGLEAFTTAIGGTSTLQPDGSAKPVIQEALR